jgi:hypothetical protein
MIAARVRGGPKRIPSPVRTAAILTELAVIAGWSFLRATPAKMKPPNVTPANATKAAGPGNAGIRSPFYRRWAEFS